jgi:GTP-binding protein YchF
VTHDESELIEEYFLLTSKPVLYAANLSEADITNGYGNNPYLNKVIEYAKSEHSEVIPICAKLEEEISVLEDEEKSAFLSDYGLEEPGLNRLIKTSYKLLGLISFLTAGTDEVRAWTITKGTKAPQAAGKIHTDFEKGFIRAEIVAYDDLITCGSEAVAKEKGLVRLEGKEYVMKDGDIVTFRFNV